MKHEAVLVTLTLSSLVSCGPTPNEEPQTGTVAQRIVGGYVDEDTRGVVGLGVDFDGQWFAGHCTGALIAPNLVMTARHCVARTSGGLDEGIVCGETGFTIQGSGDMFVASPATERPTTPLDVTFYRGEEVLAVPGANDICGFDVALIILQGAGIPVDEATPIVPRIDERAARNEQFSATGYGLTDPNGSSLGTRMRADGFTVRCTGTDCQSFTADFIRDTEWLSVDAQVCAGDSGGPALDADGRVIGIASRGEGTCGSVIYGDIAAWSDFIIEVALDAADRGGYAPPPWTSGESGQFVEQSAPEFDDPVVDEPPPPVPPLSAIGDECDGSCDGGLLCFTEDGHPPGVCSAPCGDPEDQCPDGQVCADLAGVCVGPDSPFAPAEESSGCAVGGRASTAATSWLVFAALAAALARRRRATRRITPRACGERRRGGPDRTSERENAAGIPG